MHFLDGLPLTQKERKDLLGPGAGSRLALVSALRAAGPEARAEFDRNHGRGRFDAVVGILEKGLTETERAPSPLRPLRGTGGRLPKGRS